MLAVQHPLLVRLAGEVVRLDVVGKVLVHADLVAALDRSVAEQTISLKACTKQFRN